MSDWYDYVIEEFGNSIGVKNLSFSNSKAINLSIDNLGDVFLERSSKGVSIFFIKKNYHISINKDDLCRNFLEKCHFNHKKTDLPIQIGMNSDDSFVFMITLDRENFRVHNLHKGIEVLKEISLE